MENRRASFFWPMQNRNITLRRLYLRRVISDLAAAVLVVLLALVVLIVLIVLLLVLAVLLVLIVVLILVVILIIVLVEAHWLFLLFKFRG